MASLDPLDPLDHRSDLDPAEKSPGMARSPGGRSPARRTRAGPFFLLAELFTAAAGAGAVPGRLTTPYVNTIPPEREAPRAGDPDLERRIKSIVRWNAMAMVVHANREIGPRRPHRELRLGGHALRDRLQPLLPRARRERKANHGRRPALLPGPLLARRLRPRLPRRTDQRRCSSSTSAARWTRRGCRRTPIPG